MLFHYDFLTSKDVDSCGKTFDHVGVGVSEYADSLGVEYVATELGIAIDG